jgi:hypothetical protein
MRPYLVLTTVVLLAVSVFAQQPFPHPGPCLYGCGPYVPLLTTPQLSLQTFSPNPVGASNATTGLIAGATNSTLSQIEGSTSSVYTEAVWYQGGAPLTTSQVHLWPEAIGREGHVMREPMYEERGREEHAREDRGPREEARRTWTYFTGQEYTESPVGTAKGKKAAHSYTNDDVTRQNDKNGTVKYDGKTEKM